MTEVQEFRQKVATAQYELEQLKLSVKIDVQYAIRQIEKFGDVSRAMDALKRIEALCV